MRFFGMLALALAVCGSHTVFAQDDANLEDISPPPIVGPDGRVVEYIDLGEPEPAPRSWAWYKPVTKNWSGSIELGIGGTEGNTQTFNIRAGGKAKHVIKDWQKITLNVIYIDKSQDGDKIAQNTQFDGRLENTYKPTRWTTFVHGLAEQDLFKEFDWRIAADAGVGYQWVDNERSNFTTRFGGSTSREIGGADDEWKPELVFGAEFSHQINKWQKFNIQSEYHPNVSNFEDFRLNSSADYELLLSQEWNLSLKLGVIDRYDSTPGTRLANDLTYSTLMLLGF